MAKPAWVLVILAVKVDDMMNVVETGTVIVTAIVTGTESVAVDLAMTVIESVVRVVSIPLMAFVGFESTNSFPIKVAVRGGVVAIVLMDVETSIAAKICPSTVSMGRKSKRNTVETTSCHYLYHWRCIHHLLPFQLFTNKRAFIRLC